MLITVHELGHFIAARMAGVRVLRFSIGFGPSICSFTGRRGTEFRLLFTFRWFVEMQGKRLAKKMTCRITPTAYPPSREFALEADHYFGWPRRQLFTGSNYLHDHILRGLRRVKPCFRGRERG